MNTNTSELTGTVESGKQKTEIARPKATLCKAALLLCHVAVRSHTLRDMFGIEQVGEEPTSRIRFTPGVPRPWLELEHPSRPNEYTFSSDKFASRLGARSTGENHMMLWILNVWNPGYARSKGWDFNFFRAMDSLDRENREAIAWWMQNPVRP